MPEQRARPGGAVIALAACLLWGTPVLADEGAEVMEAGCRDVLAGWPDKPPSMEFAGCHHGLQVSVVNYRVSGVDAAPLAERLGREAGMPPLRFVCCGWEIRPDAQGSRYGLLPLPDGRAYGIAMYSGETPEQHDWTRIDHFYVEVTIRCDC